MNSLLQTPIVSLFVVKGDPAEVRATYQTRLLKLLFKAHFFDSVYTSGTRDPLFDVEQIAIHIQGREELNTYTFPLELPLDWVEERMLHMGNALDQVTKVFEDLEDGIY